MKEVAAIIKAVGRATGNDKLAVLKKYAGTPGLKEILRFIYNPYCKTGISDAKLYSANWDISCSTPITWQDAIAYFSKHQTGSSADVLYARKFMHSSKVFGDDAVELAAAIVTQNLKIGVNVTSLNKVYGASFIPKTGCMLGTLYSDVNESTIQWPCIVTEKLDGIRRIMIKENGAVSMFSRSGHPDDGLTEIIDAAKYLPDNYVYDGELLARGAFKDNIAIRQATNSIANSKGTRSGVIFNVFDMLPVEDFYAGKSSATARTRKILLGATFMDDSISILDTDWSQRIAAFGIYRDLEVIKSVPILGLVHNLQQVEPIVSSIWARGGEGVMLNTTNGYYEIKRSKQLLKIKHTEEHVLTVVDTVEGTGKYEDTLGALVCLYVSASGEQCFVGVGSGLTDTQRNDIWQEPAKYIGRKVEVECFGESINAQGYTSLNCPIFLRFADVEHE